ncbi:MAG TPA: XRE family transcriptional regulator [Bryobacteraceae bacterium]|nr:XRE family transcriptional regulator [Bryobacteraceae bacterium]
MPDLFESPNPIINPARIASARMRRGFTMTFFAQKIGVDLKTLGAYEKGGSVPTPPIMDRICSATGFPVEFFYRDDLEIPGNVSFRSLSRMSSRQRDMAISQGSLALELSAWLNEKFELPPCNLPDLGSEASDMEAAAASVRRVWNLGEMPIRNMIHLLEANGIRVFSLSIDAIEVDAFSMWSGGNPVIMLNTFKSAERSRFDAAHELAHLVLHRHGGPNSNREAEVQADAFASAFLMPKGSVEANAPTFPTVAELIRLKKIWGVAATALNYRLHKLGLLTDWHYRRLCVQLSARGHRSEEPQGMARESSAILPKLLTNLYQEDNLTRSAIARDLAFPVSELNYLLFGLTISAIESPIPRRGNPRLKTGGSGLQLVERITSTSEPSQPSLQLPSVYED